MFTESVTAGYRAGTVQYFSGSDYGFIGTWGAGIYFGRYKDVAELYDRDGQIPIGVYNLKGTLVSSEEDRPLPSNIYYKILKDLKLDKVMDYVNPNQDAVESGFFVQVNSIVITGTNKGLKEEKIFKAIKKHTKISGFDARTEIVMFLKSDVVLQTYLN